MVLARLAIIKKFYGDLYRPKDYFKDEHRRVS